MSFRVWFLRMVWIVAAAVALSGCNGDDNGDDDNGTPEPNGSDPGLAIGAISNVTMGAGNEEAAIKVTITSDDDADKTAEVTLTVKCGTADVSLGDDAKMAAVGGVADFGNVDLGDQDTAVECKVNASATLGGEMVNATEVKFDIVAAGSSLVAHEVSFEEPAADVDSNGTKVKATAFDIKVSVSPADSSATSDLTADESVTIKYLCHTTNSLPGTPNWVDFSTAVTATAPKDGVDSASVSITIPSSANGNYCWLQACANVGVENNARASHCATRLVITQ